MCVVFLCLCHFPIWCFGSGVVLDFIVSPIFAFFSTCELQKRATRIILKSDYIKPLVDMSNERQNLLAHAQIQKAL